MKKLITTLMMALSLAGCASNLETKDGTYHPYGIANENSVKSDNVCYSLSFTDAVVGIILIETIIVPVYIVGWDMMEPQKVKGPNDHC